MQADSYAKRYDNACQSLKAKFDKFDAVIATSNHNLSGGGPKITDISVNCRYKKMDFSSSKFHKHLYCLAAEPRSTRLGIPAKTRRTLSHS